MSGDSIQHGKDSNPGYFGGIAEAVAKAGLALAQEAQELQKQQQKEHQKNSGTQNIDKPFFERADTSEDFLLTREELKNGLKEESKKDGAEKNPEIRDYTKIYQNFDQIAGDDKLLSVMEIVNFEFGQMGHKDK